MRFCKRDLRRASLILAALTGLATLVAAALAAQTAADLDGRYPAGTIKTAATAQQALVDAGTVREALDSSYKSETSRCLRVFLQTACQEKARKTYMKGQEKVHRVEVEAHDLQRELAARQHAADQQAQQEQLRREQAERPQKEADAHKAGQDRSAHAQEQEQEALHKQDQAEGNRKGYEQRNSQHDKDEAERASVRLRSVAQNEKRYRDKQDSAKAYAQSRQREREEKRKEREAKLKAQAAAQSAGVSAPRLGD